MRGRSFQVKEARYREALGQKRVWPETSRMAALVGAMSEKRMRTDAGELGGGFLSESCGLVKSVDLC